MVAAGVFPGTHTTLRRQRGCHDRQPCRHCPSSSPTTPPGSASGLSDERHAQQRAYWTEQLTALPPALELPADRPRPARPSGQGGVHRFQIPTDVVARLRQLAREEGTSLFTLMLATYQVWLHRYTGQDDLIVGTPVAHRDRVELQSLLGFFLNTLPIRTQLNGDLSFRDVLARVRQTVLAGLEHGDLPFEQMVELAAGGRTAGQSPLYQVMFVLLEEGVAPWRLGPAAAQTLDVHTGTSKNDLVLSVTAEGDEWTCELEYASDLFSDATARRMATHWEELLQFARGRSRPADRTCEHAAGRRASATARGMEQHGHRLPARQVHTSIIRRAGGAYARRRGSHCERRASDVSGAQPPREPGSSPFAATWSGGRDSRWASTWIVRSNSWSACWRFSKPVASMYPWLGLPSRPTCGSCSRTVVPASLLTQTSTARRLRPELDSRRSICTRTRHRWTRIRQTDPQIRRRCARPGATSCTRPVRPGRPKGVAIPHRGVVRLVRGQEYVEFGSAHRFLFLGIHFVRRVDVRFVEPALQWGHLCGLSRRNCPISRVWKNSSATSR